MEITLKKIFELLLANFIIILCVAIIFSASAFCISKLAIDPSYLSEVKFIVNIDKELLNGTTAGNLNGITLARKEVETYLEIIKTPDCLQRAVDHANVTGMTSGKLAKMISTSIINETEIFKISVYSNDPQIAKKMADSLMEVLPGYLHEIRENDNQVKPIQVPVLPTSPVSPNITLNTIVGFLLGFMASLLVIVLKDIFDVRIRDVEEISRMYGLPILGTVPVFGAGTAANKKANARAKQ